MCYTFYCSIFKSLNWLYCLFFSFSFLQPGKYLRTCKEVCDIVMRGGFTIHSCGVEKVKMQIIIISLSVIARVTGQQIIFAS